MNDTASVPPVWYCFLAGF